MAFWSKKQSNPDDEHQLGVDALDRGDMAKALEHFTAAIEVEPTAERYYCRGVVNDMLHNFNESIADLNASIELDSSDSRALFSLSMVCWSSEHIEESFQAIQKAYDIDSNDFRITNHYAIMLCSSPIESHRDLARAVEMAKHGCELTDWQDEICLTTYRQVMEDIGETEESETASEKLDEVMDETDEDNSQEVIDYFEQVSKLKVTGMSLQHIIPPPINVSVQTIRHESQATCVIFTTGMSNLALKSPSRAFRFAELSMSIEADWQMESSSDMTSTNWPWFMLHRLALHIHLSGEPVSDTASVVSLEETPEPFVEGCDFAAFLLVPNLGVPFTKFEPRYSAREINIITAVPIYREEYAMAFEPAGAMGLIKRMHQHNIGPLLIPGRMNMMTLA
jgi:tetratricopeptide (TPR) repeat protein